MVTGSGVAFGTGVTWEGGSGVLVACEEVPSPLGILTSLSLREIAISSTISSERIRAILSLSPFRRILFIVSLQFFPVMCHPVAEFVIFFTNMALLSLTEVLSLCSTLIRFASH